MLSYATKCTPVTVKIQTFAASCNSAFEDRGHQQHLTTITKVPGTQQQK